MRKYIAFLRGINISGRHKIGMSDLKMDLNSWDLRMLQPI